MTLQPCLTPVELLCAVLGIGIQALFLASRKPAAGRLVPALLFMIPATFLAATAFTRFLSWDESYIFYDIINYHSSRLPHWEYGVFRTSITFFGPLYHAVQAITGLTKDLTLVLAKAVNWMVGMLLVTLIIDRLHRLLESKDSLCFRHAVLYNSMLLLPVTGLALKTLNYDLLSMLLSMLGCLLLVDGVRSKKTVLLFASVIIMTLAAHEKQIASPLLWLSMILTTVSIVAKGEHRTWLKVVSGSTIWSVLVTSASFVVIGASFAFVYATHGPDGPIFSTGRLFAAYESIFWPFCRILAIPFSDPLPDGSTCLAIGKAFFRGIRIMGAVFSASLLLTFMCRKGNVVFHRIPPAISKSLVIAHTRLFILFVVTITGIIAGYTLDAKIWPLIPVGSGSYVPVVTFNGIALHFGSPGFFWHTAASAAWGCAVFVNGIPTVLLGMLFIGSIYRIITIRNTSRQWRPLYDLMAILFLSSPVLYGALQIPLYPRYLNLFLLGTVVTIVPEILTTELLKAKITRGIAVAGLVLLLAECFPFQPLGATFRPIWSNYSKSFNANPSFGMVAPWYPGWGEELLAAFDRIKAMTRDSAEMITLFHNFPAALIRPPENVRISAMQVGHGQLDYSYGECDYYILSRNGVASYPYLGFPYEIKPFFTIADRGFVKAWVFRGSDLGKAGFIFGEPD